MLLCRKTFNIPVMVFLCEATSHNAQECISFRMLRFSACTNDKQKKLEGGAWKTRAAKYSTEVQQKEQKRKAPKPTLRNKGLGEASTEEKQKVQKAKTTVGGKPNIREPDYLYH